jgi:glycosyltransferase involved in cell wall biosynthesis
VSRRATIGYIPYRVTTGSAEASWLAEHLSVDVLVAGQTRSLNDPRIALPVRGELTSAVHDLVRLPAIIAEGPAGFLWVAVLRACGYTGAVAVIPYLNPRGWRDVAAIGIYRRFARAGDRAFLGSTPSAGIYRSLGVATSVGEPYGIDTQLFRVRPTSVRTRLQFGIPPGRMILFAGRMQPDKDVYCVLRAGLRAQILFSDLQVVVAAHVEDPGYAAAARRQLADHSSVHFITDPTRLELANLYCESDVFVTASTSGFETFGRGPAEALACGAPAIAPRYDGFAEVLDQPGGTVVDVVLDPRTDAPHVDEELLLRAIYDTLSDPRPAPRQKVSMIATRRFARSRMLRKLSYLVRGEHPPRASTAHPPRGASAVPPPPTLPESWRRSLEQISRSRPEDALSWLLERCDHDCLIAHDDEFAASVRRSLCPPAIGAQKGLLTCR